MILKTNIYHIAEQGVFDLLDFYKGFCNVNKVHWTNYALTRLLQRNIGMDNIKHVLCNSYKYSTL